MQTTQEKIINVPEIEPRLKHLTIFQTFDSLVPGESMIIHNNHDPRPVYFQLQEMRGDIFTWQYLQQGPEWWDIRVTKKAEAQEPVYVNENGDIVIIAPALEPKVKHDTIFHTYSHLEPGHSMIIHNDHDPKPVYYHLQSMHGDVFTWSYLQQGPEWWDVKITKKVIEQGEDIVAKALSAGTNPLSKKETTITIPMLPPKLKHPTIFNVFDSLETGESLVIHNDHDPKPVYYQLLGERGDVFTWEYLQQGPQWWDIRVTKKDSNDLETVGQIAAKDLRKAEVFKKYGIDFCCGGKKTVREVCAEKGIDATKVEQELQQTAKNVTSGNNNFNEWNLDFLADYIVNTHHNYIRKYLPEIRGYALKVAQVHGAHHNELFPIQQLVENIHEDLSEHINDEENVLFPLVKKIVQAKNSNTSYSKNSSEDFAAIVNEREQEHDNIGNTLDEIRKLSNEFAIPEDACASYKLFYKMVEEFENDIHIHVHLENNILFPKAIELEKTLS